MLARVRETVDTPKESLRDRHLWVRSSGIGLVGNGSTSVGVLLASQHAAARANITLLSQADNADFSCIDKNFQPESFRSRSRIFQLSLQIVATLSTKANDYLIVVSLT